MRAGRRQRGRLAGPALAAGAIAALTALAALAACTDIFHSTADFLDECDVDADNPGCNSICTSDSAAARRMAENACARLGDCVLPIGDNQFGACVFHGVLAYDCNANPNRTVQGADRKIWDCLKNVSTCGDVLGCVSGLLCGSNGAPASCQGPTLRVTCDDAGAGNENCAAWGQTCVGNACSAAPASSGAPSCSGAPACDGPTTLRACSDAGTALTVDCTSFGAARCASTPAGAACVGDHAGACAPSSQSVACKGDVASGCPAGLGESVDCSLLTGPGSCHAGATVGAAIGVAEACVGSACGPGTPDSCNGTMLTSCYRGQSFTYDCARLSAQCREIATPDGVRAACAP